MDRGTAFGERIGLLAANELVNLWVVLRLLRSGGDCPVFGLLSRPIAAKTAGYRSTSMGIAVFHLTVPDDFPNHSGGPP